MRISAGLQYIRRRWCITPACPNTGMPVCYAPQVETGPRHKGGELLEPPILTTTPQRSHPWSPFTRGGIEVEVSNRKKSAAVGYRLIAVG